MTSFNLFCDANFSINHGNNLKNQGYSSTNSYEKHQLITKGKQFIQIGLKYKDLSIQFKKK